MTPEQQKVVLDLVISYIVVLVSLGCHEFGHAWTAVMFGDPTPREEGRYTLNPVKHMDLLGTVLVPIAAMLLKTQPFAWAKPVNYSGYRFSRRVSVKTGLMACAAAGPVVNLVLAIVGAFVLAAMAHQHREWFGWWFKAAMGHLLAWNTLLFLFNLLPVPPLDGARVVKGFLPYSWQNAYGQVERFGPIFLAVLLVYVGGAVVQVPRAWLEGELMTLARLVFP
jgi:Zn-dependent protease